MSGSTTFDIKIGRIRAVYMPHNLRQITRRRLEQQVIMVIHHAVCVNERIISLRCGLKVFKKFLPVTCAFEDSFALISTWSYMIKGAGECYSQSASHDRSFIKDLFSPSAEDGLDPYSWLGDICQEWRLDPTVFWLFKKAISRVYLPHLREYTGGDMETF